MIEKRAAIVKQTGRAIVNGHSPINFSPKKVTQISKTLSLWNNHIKEWNFKKNW